MKKNTLGSIRYVLSGTWKYEKRVILILILQTMIGVIVPLMGVALPALVVNGVSNGLGYAVITEIAAVILLLLACNTVSAYLSGITGTYLLNNKMGFLTALFRKKMELDYAYIESPQGQNQFENALMSLLNDNQGITGMLSLLGPALGNLLSLAVNVALIVKFNIWIVAVLAATSALHLFLASRIRGKEDALREPLADSNRKLNYLFRYGSEHTSAREIRVFDMQTWIQNVIKRAVQARLAIAQKSAGYHFYLSVSDSLMLIIRDAFAYLITVRAVLAGEIEVWELVLYLGVITCTSSLFMSLTNHMASLGQRCLEVVSFREFLDRDSPGGGKEIPDGPDGGKEISGGPGGEKGGGQAAPFGSSSGTFPSGSVRTAPISCGIST